jgi:hypothetical protein
VPIIILILVIVFFAPLLSAAFYSIVGLAGLLFLFLKALPYIIAGIAVIWGSLFLLGKTINFGALKFRKKTLREITEELVKQNLNIIYKNSHLLDKRDVIIIGRYYLINGKYENCPRFKELTPESQKIMKSYIEMIFKPALKKVRRNKKLFVNRT